MIKDSDTRDHIAPIQSLLTKSEKALTKVREGTWQHAMLTRNIDALHIVSSLMTGENIEASSDDLHDARVAVTDMIRRTEESEGKFAEGTAQNTLQTNRLAALRVSATLVQTALIQDALNTETPAQ